MTAMHKATDNATDLRNDLKLTYNKAVKHLLLTKLEIVGGAEALNG
jgi:F-type H+-transporting ATPase subunit gamma